MMQGSRRQPAGLSKDLANKKRCLVVGVLNVTPDSFSDGGLFTDTTTAISHAKQLIAQGADLIDVGGESTKPGASRIENIEEQKRVIPVIEELTNLGIITSIDTMRSQTAELAVKAGAQNSSWIRCALCINALARALHSYGRISKLPKCC
jgi:dihydropteroate synthase